MLFNNLFRNCKSIPAETTQGYQWNEVALALWQDKTKTWEGLANTDKDGYWKSRPFYGCSDELCAKIPVAWGGTNALIDVTNANDSFKKINTELDEINSVINDDSLLSQNENQKTLIDNI